MMILNRKNINVMGIYLMISLETMKSVPSFIVPIPSTHNHRVTTSTTFTTSKRYANTFMDSEQIIKQTNDNEKPFLQDMNPKEMKQVLQELKKEHKMLSKRVSDIDVKINKLTNIALKLFDKERKRQEEEQKKYLVHILGHEIFLIEPKEKDHPAGLHPIGWVGEIGEGPKTAYEVLAPHKWYKRIGMRKRRK